MNSYQTFPCEFSEATFYDVKDINSSFARGKLKVCYVGDNRNGSSFSKDSIIAALPSLRNVPIVCHWDYETNTIGAHDVEIAHRQDGSAYIRNLTEPCGVVPENAEFTFQIETKDGKQYDTLVINEVILWKRQDVYSHILNDLGGRVDHSMEVHVIDGMTDQRGVFNITDFEFTALCLLESAKPCYENSELELFSVDNFKFKFEEMLKEFEELKNLLTTSQEGVNINPQFVEKGGDSALDKLALLAKYNLSVENLDFSIEDLTFEELEQKLVELGYSDEEPAEEPSEPEPESQGDELEAPQTEEQFEISEEETSQEEAEFEDIEDANLEEKKPVQQDFALNGQIQEGLFTSLADVKCDTEWGQVPRYSFVDFDLESSMVYCYDILDWKLYGLAFALDGDNVKIDFKCKKRMKFAIVEYDEGSESLAEQMFSELQRNTYSYNSIKDELVSLREFKHEVEDSKEKEKVEEIFSKFADLEGIEEFELLKEDYSNYEADALEDKCFAIRGRNISLLKFSHNSKQTKLVVERNNTIEDSEPYSGIFVRRGIV